MSFKTEIEAIVGDIDSPDVTSEATLYLKEGTRFVIKSLMNVDSLVNKLTSSSTLNNSTPTLSVSDILKVASVTRGDGSRQRVALEIEPERADEYTDTNSIYYTSKLDPKYYISNSTLNVIPTPTATETATIRKIGLDSSIALSDTSIDNFPDELERGVVLYTSKELLRLFLNNRNATLTGLSLANISAPNNISISGVSYSDASAGDATAATVSSVTIGSVSDADVTTNNSAISALPAYAPASLSLTGAPSINDLTISSSAPNAPTVTDVTIGSFGSAPSYSAPSLDINYTQLGSSSDAFGVDDLVTGEDIELAQTVLAKHEQQIQKYQVDIQNQLNVFNDSLSEYQATVQKVLQQAETEQSESAQAIQKYAAEIEAYQTNVNKEVSAYQASTEKSINIFRTERDSEVQKYSVDTQNALNEFNEKVTNYQAEVQEELQKQNVALERARVDATTGAAKAQQDAQMATEISQINKQKDLQLSLQNKSKALEAAINDNNLKVANYQAQVESYAQQVNEAIQTYTLAFQEVVQDYNWYVQQYQIVTQDLVTFLSQYLTMEEMPDEVTADDRPS